MTYKKTFMEPGGPGFLGVIFSSLWVTTKDQPRLFQTSQVGAKRKLKREFGTIEANVTF